jgi:diguanylate cyclase (GGDEF)-like protein/PAS domain S-box-containing protein
MQLISDQHSLFGLYKSVFEYNPDASYAMVNETAIKLTGYTREELRQLSFPDILREDCIKASYNCFLQVLKGEKITLEVSIMHKNGKYIDLYVTAVPIIIENQVLGMAGIAQDITEKKHIQKELENSQEQLQSIFNSLDVFLWSMNAERTTFLQASPACQKIYGYSQKSIYENPMIWKKIIHPDDLALVKEKQKRITSEGIPLTSEYRIIDASGNVKWISSYTIPVFNEIGEIIRYDGIVTDISQKRKAEEELEFMAFHDLLTELPNRRAFQRKLNRSLKAAEEKQTKAAILYLDLDHFKLINDALGHKVGDELLQTIAKRLKDCLHQSAFLARQGGDEFAVLLENIKNVEEVFNVTRKLINVVTKPLYLAGRNYVLTTSIGISVYPDHADDTENLIKRADQAMYVAKANGKNSYRMYHHAMSDNLNRRLELEQELRQALKENALSLYYQPIVNIKENRIAGFEALIRWNHKSLGFISPAEFIPIAEESGLIIPIGDLVLRTACLQFKELMKKNDSPIYVSVNVSTRQFEEEQFVSKVKHIINETKFDPYLLKIEITESVMMQDIEDIVTKLRGLEELGIEVMLDDFGTGYSSLYYLQKLPANMMKIDRSFVQSINSNSGHEAIIRTIIAMADSLGMGIVAEGVEHEEQLQYLREQGCVFIQGFLFSKPVPFEELPELLEKGLP